MSIETTIPVNRNPLSQLKFRFFVKKAPTINFFVQAANVPSIYIQPTEHATPFVKIPYPGDHIDYEDLSITFMVDEDLENYKEIHNWIRGIGFPTDYSEYKNLYDKDKNTKTNAEGIRSDISLFILSSKDVPIFDITYIDAFPYALSGLYFNSTDESTTYLTAEAKFKYTYYDINVL